jgi:hypothetical protein
MAGPRIDSITCRPTFARAGIIRLCGRMSRMPARYLLSRIEVMSLVLKFDEYPYSGHHSYLEGRASEVLEPEQVLDMLGRRAGYRRFVLDGLKEGHREDYYQVEDQRFLGAEEFSHKVKIKVHEEEIPA